VDAAGVIRVGVGKDGGGIWGPYGRQDGVVVAELVENAAVGAPGKVVAADRVVV
jgi:hypothetical protein